MREEGVSEIEEKINERWGS